MDKSALLRIMPVWFKKYNKQLWNNQLSAPLLQVKTLKNKVGLYSPKDKSITLSDFYGLSEEQFISVFIHEMIHLYQDEFYDVVDHGRTFNQELVRINRLLPFEIKKTENAYEAEYGQDAGKDVGVVLGKDDKGSFIVTFRLDFFLNQSNRSTIEKVIKQNFRSAIIVTGISNHPKLQTFKTKRSLRSLEVYDLADKYYNDIYDSIQNKKWIK